MPWLFHYSFRMASYRCNYCESTFTRKRNLTRHIREQHTRQDIKFWMCPEEDCDQHFYRRGNLRHHLQRVHRLSSRVSLERSISARQQPTRPSTTIYSDISDDDSLLDFVTELDNLTNSCEYEPSTTDSFLDSVLPTNYYQPISPESSDDTSENSYVNNAIDACYVNNSADANDAVNSIDTKDTYYASDTCDASETSDTIDVNDANNSDDANDAVHCNDTKDASDSNYASDSSDADDADARDSINPDASDAFDTNDVSDDDYFHVPPKPAFNDDFNSSNVHTSQTMFDDVTSPSLDSPTSCSVNTEPDVIIIPDDSVTCTELMPYSATVPQPQVEDDMCTDLEHSVLTSRYEVHQVTVTREYRYLNGTLMNIVTSFEREYFEF